MGTFIDNFTYANGSLTGKGTWITSGVAPTGLQVTSNAIVMNASAHKANKSQSANLPADWDAPWTIQFTAKVTIDTDDGITANFRCGDPAFGSAQSYFILAANNPSGDRAAFSWVDPTHGAVSSGEVVFTNGVVHTILFAYKDDVATVKVDGVLVLTTPADTSNTHPAEFCFDNDQNDFDVLTIDSLIIQSGLPVLTAPTVNAAGTIITATLSRTDCSPASGTGHFTISGTTATVASWTVAGAVLTITLTGTTIKSTDTITYSYTALGDASDIVDGNADVLANFSSVSVTNNATPSTDPEGTSSRTRLAGLTTHRNRSRTS